MSTSATSSVVPLGPSGSKLLADALREQGATIFVKRGSVVREQAEGSYVYFVDEGFSVAKKALRGGGRQTVSIFVPGDIIDHELVTIGGVFSTIYALTDLALLRVPARDLSKALADDAFSARLFLRYVAYQGLLAHEWLLRIGCLKAQEKTAHLVCEIFRRVRLAGGVEGDYCPLAISQHELSDILGLSVVQQNRSLAKLQRAGLLEWKPVRRCAGAGHRSLLKTPTSRGMRLLAVVKVGSEFTFRAHFVSGRR